MYRSVGIIGIFVLGTLGLGCMDQYHPEPYWAQFAKEREVASRPVAKLTEKGEIPAAGGAVLSPEQRYEQLCATCHGSAGDGNGPAGQALNPKPRNFTDVAWQNATDDGRIHKVIKEGGSSVGLSALMAAWGSKITDPEIDALVAYIRKFKK